MPATPAATTDAADTEVAPAVSSPGRWARSARTTRVAMVGGAVALLAGGTLLVGQLAAGDGATPSAPPSYPAVEGSVGEALTTLQQSVEP